jgi:hypothetical protein
MRDGSLPSITALLICRPPDVRRLDETLLSLAAQTVSEFEVCVVVTDGSTGPAVAELVETFDDTFAARVAVVPMDPSESGPPFAFGLARSRTAYVAPVYPDDVVFAHWIESFVDHAAAAGGRAIASLVATQVVEHAAWGDGRRVTTVRRPLVVDADEVDLLAQLTSAPMRLGGLAVPRQAVLDLLSVEMPPVAEEWAIRFVVALTCGVYETGEVTYLDRSVPSTGHVPQDGDEWERHRATTLEILDRRGLVLGAGVLQSMHQWAASAPSREERDRLLIQLRQAEEVSRAHAAGEVAALDRVSALLASASWKATAPLRAVGDAVRHRRGSVGHHPRT